LTDSFFVSVGSLLKILLHGVDLGGEDTFDLLNNVDFGGSGGLVGLVLNSPILTLDFLGLLGSESVLLLGGGVVELLLLDGKGSFGLSELLLRLREGLGNLGSGGLDFTEEDLVLSDGGLLVDLVVFDGGFEGVSEVFHLVHDVFEGFLGEGRGDLDEGGDGVGTSDLGELDEGGFGIRLGADGLELLDDQFEGTDNLHRLSLSGLKVGSVLFSGVSQIDLSGVEDLELELLVLDVNVESVDLGLEVGDLSLRFGDLDGGNVDSSVELLDLGGALVLSLGVDLVVVLLLEGQVLSDLFQHLGDITEG